MSKTYSEERKPTSVSASGRHFLFLQGPIGPFFKELGRFLGQKTQAKISRINFSGGDCIDWYGKNTHSYTNTLENWDTWVSHFFQEHKVTDLVLFGDCRPYHKIAIKIAQEQKIQLHLFEEGYLRPQWITHENKGVNGHSGIKKEFLEHNPDDLLDLDIESEQCGEITRCMVVYTIKHYFFKLLGELKYKNFITHRQTGYVKDFCAWLKWGTWVRQRRQDKDSERCKAFIAEKKPFFFMPLQLEHDAQVLHHSKYQDYEVFVDDVIKSFAEHAPKNHLLVIKTHPLDNHIKSWKDICTNIADKYGIKQRLLVLEGGHLPTILDWTKGTVVLNSTVGIQAVHHGCPTIALGEATYDIPKLTNQKSLNEFWNKPEAPCQKTYLKFFRFMIATSQINGNFYTAKGRKLVWQDKIIRFMLNNKCTKPHCIKTQ